MLALGSGCQSSTFGYNNMIPKSKVSRFRRWLWILIAIASGVSQLILIGFGGRYLMGIYPYPWIKYVIGFTLLWSLIWPFYVYCGMNQSYLDMIEASRKRLSGSQDSNDSF